VVDCFCSRARSFSKSSLWLGPNPGRAASKRASSFAWRAERSPSERDSTPTHASRAETQIQIQMVKLSTAHRVARVAKPSITTPARSSRTAGVARAEAKPSFASSLAACVAVALSVSAPGVALALEANERDSDFVAGASQFASLGSRGPGPVMDDGSI